MTEDTSINKVHIHQQMNRNYSREDNLIAKIFPRGLDISKEHFGRGIACRIGYNNLSNYGKGTIEEVDINSIYPCQQVLICSKVIDLMLYLRDNEVPGYPIGLKIGEDVYLVDGHHRVSAQILLGRKTVMMLLTTLKEDDPCILSANKPLKEEVINTQRNIIQDKYNNKQVVDTVTDENLPKVFNKAYFKRLAELKQQEEANKKKEES